MSHEIEQCDPNEARATLVALERTKSAGLKRGLYPRWFAAVSSLWAGAVAASVGSAVLLPVLFGGFFAIWYYRRKRGAWIREVQSSRELWLVIPLGLMFGALLLSGAVVRDLYDLPYAPLVGGVVVAAGLFSILEIAYRPLRARLELDGEGS